MPKRHLLVFLVFTVKSVFEAFLGVLGNPINKIQQKIWKKNCEKARSITEHAQ